MPGKRWTDNDINILRDNAGKMSSTDIGELIGKSNQSVQAKASRLGITLDGYYKKVICIDCGTPTSVSWQTNNEIRCPICRERHFREYHYKITQKKFNMQAYSGNRHDVFQRDGYQCRLCGSKKNLIIHHINEMSYHNSDTPDNDMNNLTTLCKSCHGLYHMTKTRNKYKELGAAK